MALRSWLGRKGLGQAPSSSVFPMLHLEAPLLLEATVALSARIEARFPESTLNRLARSLGSCIEQADSHRETLSRPILLFRIGAAFISALLVASVIYVALFVTPDMSSWDLPAVLQMIESAINDIVFVSLAIFFLFTFEGRLRRQQLIRRIHDLRALAHLIDMVQLTKDPEECVLGSGPRTSASPRQPLTAFELNRYLDYCSELLSLTSKVGVLYTQGISDEVVSTEVNELDELCTGLSRKIWQKIMLLEQMRGHVADDRPADGCPAHGVATERT